MLLFLNGEREFSCSVYLYFYSVVFKITPVSLFLYSGDQSDWYQRSLILKRKTENVKKASLAKVQLSIPP